MPNGSFTSAQNRNGASTTSGMPTGSIEHTYAYDAVGNVVAVYNASTSGRGNELYYFSQDAFGNELSDDPSLPASQRTNVLGGARWSDARSAGITEHQTGKWVDEFTGLYYFHARYYDAEVGRFVGRDLNRFEQAVWGDNAYSIVLNRPTVLVDPDGYKPKWPKYPPKPSSRFQRCLDAIKKAVDDQLSALDQSTLDALKEKLEAQLAECDRMIKQTRWDHAVPNRNYTQGCECSIGREVDACQEICYLMELLHDERMKIAKSIRKNADVIEACVPVAPWEWWLLDQLTNTAINLGVSAMMGKDSTFELPLPCICGFGGNEPDSD